MISIEIRKERYVYAYYVVNNKVSQVVPYRFELEVSNIVKSYTIPESIIHRPHDESQSTNKRSVKIYMKSERKQEKCPRESKQEQEKC